MSFIVVAPVTTLAVTNGLTRVSGAANTMRFGRMFTALGVKRDNARDRVIEAKGVRDEVQTEVEPVTNAADTVTVTNAVPDKVEGN